MVKMFAAISFGAAVALSPLAASAQSDAPAQPEQVAQATTGSAHAGGRDRKSTRLNSSHLKLSRMPSSA